MAEHSGQDKTEYEGKVVLAAQKYFNQGQIVVFQPFVKPNLLIFRPNSRSFVLQGIYWNRVQVQQPIEVVGFVRSACTDQLGE